MISTVLMLWLFGLAVVLVLRRNPNRAAWVDGVYDIIYVPVFNFLQSMRNTFRKNNSDQSAANLAASAPPSINSTANMEAVELQFQSQDGLWVTDNTIAGPTNAQAIAISLSSLLRRKAGAPGYAGRVRAIGSISGHVYELR